MEKADLLLKGAVDMHAHGYPQFTLGMPPRVNNLEWAQAAQEAGMAGFVIKSHLWPTAAEAYLLNAMALGVRVFGSITLNYAVGGIDPLAVQIAAESGAKVVFMPTWCSKNDMSKGARYVDRMRPYVTTIDEAMKDKPGLTVVGGDGELIPEVHAILALCRQYGLVLGSWPPVHRGEPEAVQAARRRRAFKFVLNHPLSAAPHRKPRSEQIQAGRRYGRVYRERFILGCMPYARGPQAGAASPRRSGSSAASAARWPSDANEAWNPKPAGGAPDVYRVAACPRRFRTRGDLRDDARESRIFYWMWIRRMEL
jgi:hypothetical protein